MSMLWLVQDSQQQASWCTLRAPVLMHHCTRALQAWGDEDVPAILDYMSEKLREGIQVRGWETAWGLGSAIAPHAQGTQPGGRARDMLCSAAGSTALKCGRAWEAFLHTVWILVLTHQASHPQRQGPIHSCLYAPWLHACAHAPCMRACAHAYAPHRCCRRLTSTARRWRAGSWTGRRCTRPTRSGARTSTSSRSATSWCARCYCYCSVGICVLVCMWALGSSAGPTALQAYPHVPLLSSAPAWHFQFLGNVYADMVGSGNASTHSTTTCRG